MLNLTLATCLVRFLDSCQGRGLPCLGAGGLGGESKPASCRPCWPSGRPSGSLAPPLYSASPVATHRQPPCLQAWNQDDQSMVLGRDLRGITCIASEWQLATRPSQTDDRSSHQVAPKAVEKNVAKSIMLAPHAVTIFRGGHTASRREACAKKRQNRTKNWSNLTCATPGFRVACGDASLRVGRVFPTAAGEEAW